MVQVRLERLVFVSNVTPSFVTILQNTFHWLVPVFLSVITRIADRDAVIQGPYNQRSIRDRIEAFFLDNLGKVATREQLIEVATDSRTAHVPENWHQRLSELRTDKGYTILSWRNQGDLRVSEYMMPNAERRPTTSRRTRPNANTWEEVLARYNNRCSWTEDGIICGLQNGDIDPVGGGTVKLTPDHRTPHAIHAEADPQDPDKWQPLLGDIKS